MYTKYNLLIILYISIIIILKYRWYSQLALGSRKNVTQNFMFSLFFFHVLKRFDSDWSPHQWEFISIKNTKEET